MSTHRSIPNMRRSIVPVMLALFGGLLITLQLMLPATAFAAPARTAPSNPPPTDPAFARAEVSVVRLIVSYTTAAAKTNSPTPTATKCTGLGILVGSWTLNSAGTGQYTNWVLTDAALLNSTRPVCAQTQQLPIVSVDVYPNTAYTNNNSPNVPPLGTLSCQTTSCSTTITSPKNGVLFVNGSVVLFSFSSTFPQPFVDMAPQNALSPHVAIELTDTSGMSPASSLLAATNPPQNFLTPTPLVLDSSTARSISNPTSTTRTAPRPEPGTPTVNKDGQLLSIQSALGSSPLPVSQADATLQKQLPQPATATSHTNPLRDNWNKGIDAFYGVRGARNYTAAANAFKAAAVNSAFQAATALMSQAIANEPSGGGPGPVASPPSQTSTVGSTPTTPAVSNPLPFGITWPLLIGGAVLLALIVLLVGIGLIVRSRARRREPEHQPGLEYQREMEHFEADAARARHAAEQRQQQARRAQAQAQVAPPVNQGSTSRSGSLPCSNCGQPVRADTPYCPYCHYPLTPPEPGKQLAARPPTVAEAPTTPILPSMPQPSAQGTPSLSDMPTLPIPPNGQLDADKRQPYTVERRTGRNLSLAVGTQTNPGIKRKYKPNEDNLLAMQGPINNHVQPQQFGLFVVADGMGGHANGQDASRLAIQTIIDYMLPLLSEGKDLQDDGFAKLLAEGVQQANQAVYKHNQEQRADMGTTMTAALVVGPMAYVANVGDSRTYLYREPEGLSKITRDHSVVASLVDAGVIKPDDIYTHPKRNQIYRSLGEKPVVEVDTFKVALQPGDKLLLCSDGLWDMVRDPEIQRLMRAPAPDPAHTGEALIQAALNGGGEDNVSVIVVYVTETTRQTGLTSVQLLYKPDSVIIPTMTK